MGVGQLAIWDGVGVGRSRRDEADDLGMAEVPNGAEHAAALSNKLPNVKLLRSAATQSSVKDGDVS